MTVRYVGLTKEQFEALPSGEQASFTAVKKFNGLEKTASQEDLQISDTGETVYKFDPLKVGSSLEMFRDSDLANNPNYNLFANDADVISLFSNNNTNQFTLQVTNNQLAVLKNCFGDILQETPLAKGASARALHTVTLSFKPPFNQKQVDALQKFIAVMKQNYSGNTDKIETAMHGAANLYTFARTAKVPKDKNSEWMHVLVPGAAALLGGLVGFAGGPLGAALGASACSMVAEAFVQSHWDHNIELDPFDIMLAGALGALGGGVEWFLAKALLARGLEAVTVKAVTTGLRIGLNAGFGAGMGVNSVYKQQKAIENSYDLDVVPLSQEEKNSEYLTAGVIGAAAAVGLGEVVHYGVPIIGAKIAPSLKAAGESISAFFEPKVVESAPAAEAAAVIEEVGHSGGWLGGLWKRIKNYNPNPFAEHVDPHAQPGGALDGMSQAERIRQLQETQAAAQRGAQPRASQVAPRVPFERLVPRQQVNRIIADLSDRVPVIPENFKNLSDVGRKIALKRMLGLADNASDEQLQIMISSTLDSYNNSFRTYRDFQVPNGMSNGAEAKQLLDRMKIFEELLLEFSQLI